eukprot:SM000213S06809  [mRNA]  locus=s213:59774:62720:- [translate_table: standard]
MGTFVGHIFPGAFFTAIGLWRLYSSLRLYCGPSFTSRPWYPARLPGGLKYLELWIILGASALHISAELFIFPRAHQPLELSDWSIPAVHLNNFEHASMSLAFLVYAAVALLAEATHALPLPPGVLNFFAAAAFSQELLLFHFHSSDHVGVESRYHELLQLPIAVCISCSLLEAVVPRAFAIDFALCWALIFQGLWFIQMGFVLWVPTFMAYGCSQVLEEGASDRYFVCDGEASMHRAKALADLQFSWYWTGVLVFCIAMYALAMRKQAGLPEYESLCSASGADTPPHIETVRSGGEAKEDSLRARLTLALSGRRVRLSRTVMAGVSRLRPALGCPSDSDVIEWLLHQAGPAIASVLTNNGQPKQLQNDSADSENGGSALDAAEV